MRQPLDTYYKKRDFSLTKEPRGRALRMKGNLFVVQKHDARRLHYDFRLEMDGVLKSWAVTRGPSLVPDEKRLAVHVEDHPLEYAGFEGTIPRGEYGGGTVIVWDRGRWKPEGDPRKQYEKGHLVFELEGEKLKGRWHLVRMHGKPGEKRENWLLIKGDDEFARNRQDADILNEQPQSVKSGRVIAEVEHEEPGWSSKTGPIRKKATAKKALPAPATFPEQAAKSKMPDFIEPALATLVADAPEGDRWMHEIKFDGYRIQAHLADGNVTLYSRGGLDWTRKFGQAIMDDLLAMGVKTAIFDGEIVVENQSGLSDFSALQSDLGDGRTDRFAYYIFDLLYCDGYDLRAVPLSDRKALAIKLVSQPSAAVRFSEGFEAAGEEVLKNACGLGLEGIVSKLKDATYSNGRTMDWRKSKCIGRQEFVIAGFVPSSATRGAIGSLVLGVHDTKGLIPVGRVGTGFSVKSAKELYSRLNTMRQEESPFMVPLTADEKRGVKFVAPELVAEIEFRAWTADKRLRHAAFRGLRDDKPAQDVKWEKQAVPAITSDASTPETDVKLTHPDRVYWPKEGVTKQGLADYYAEIWPLIEPFIINRPLALLRCPTGIEGEHFFQKHGWKGLNEHIVEVQDPSDKDEEPFISIKDFDGLIGLVQAASLEIHPWGSTLKNWEQPDMVTMDLDPGEGVVWERVIEAAFETRERLEKQGLAAFVKTSGGKGLHVVVPLKPRADWQAAKTFTKAIADQMAADSPERYVSTISKAKRKGKILIDYLRNQRGMTAVAPYSPRARPGAAVSMPLAWNELSPAIGPAHFTVLNASTRLSALKSDPWQDFRKAEVPLPKTKAK
ncbi:DNA ligase D [Falsochrobactrum shanghaiense]|uniref:DNA ligase (ATP) n=1 Tax=Falsochrobactrum shanghaiense TaxID=2201899 RepID=A0A316JC96_9HYPH|nr:DNA ligase D [Falsochrobactrum shanghaiense]PWL16633.1 DNA ligase D [Falsochrobactrum shanghaiense]